MSRSPNPFSQDGGFFASNSPNFSQSRVYKSKLSDVLLNDFILHGTDVDDPYIEHVSGNLKIFKDRIEVYRGREWYTYHDEKKNIPNTLAFTVKDARSTLKKAMVPALRATFFRGEEPSDKKFYRFGKVQDHSVGGKVVRGRKVFGKKGIYTDGEFHFVSTPGGKWRTFTRDGDHPVRVTLTDDAESGRSGYAWPSAQKILFKEEPGKARFEALPWKNKNTKAPGRKDKHVVLTVADMFFHYRYKHMKRDPDFEMEGDIIPIIDLRTKKESHMTVADVRDSLVKVKNGSGTILSGSDGYTRRSKKTMDKLEWDIHMVPFMATGSVSPYLEIPGEEELKNLISGILSRLGTIRLSKREILMTVTALLHYHQKDAIKARKEKKLVQSGKNLASKAAEKFLSRIRGKSTNSDKNKLEFVYYGNSQKITPETLYCLLSITTGNGRPNIAETQKYCNLCSVDFHQDVVSDLSHPIDPDILGDEEFEKTITKNIKKLHSTLQEKGIQAPHLITFKGLLLCSTRKKYRDTQKRFMISGKKCISLFEKNMTVDSHMEKVALTKLASVQTKEWKVMDIVRPVFNVPHQQSPLYAKTKSLFKKGDAMVSIGCEDLLFAFDLELKSPYTYHENKEGIHDTKEKLSEGMVAPLKVLLIGSGFKYYSPNEYFRPERVVVWIEDSIVYDYSINVRNLCPSKRTMLSSYETLPIDPKKTIIMESISMEDVVTIVAGAYIQHEESLSRKSLELFREKILECIPLNVRELHEENDGDVGDNSEPSTREKRKRSSPQAENTKAKKKVRLRIVHH